MEAIPDSGETNTTNVFSTPDLDPLVLTAYYQGKGQKAIERAEARKRVLVLVYFDELQESVYSEKVG